MDQELLSFLEGALQTSGFFQWGLLPKEALTFSPEVRGMCAVNRCGCYGKTWACPPAVGTLEECRTQCEPYSHLLLFSCKYDLEDSFDFEGMTEAMLRDLKKYLAALSPYIQVIEFTEDLGTQSSLLISPATYRERIKPYHRKMFDLIKSQAPDVKILFHSCGAVSELIPDFIEIGADALNPVQTSAAGMAPETLKKKFGKNICFWGGGVDTQTTLTNAAVEEVKASVKNNLDVFTPDSGYIFTQVHNVDAGVPAENLVAAFLTAKEYKL